MNSTTAEVIVDELLDELMSRRSFRREIKSMDRKTKSSFVHNLVQIIDNRLANGTNGGREGTD